MVAFIGKPNRDRVEELLETCSHTSRDASGIVFHYGDSATIQKTPGLPIKLFMDEKWSELFESRLNDVQFGMVHARNATSGSPLSNINNHPHFSKPGSILTHKGIVHALHSIEDESLCDSKHLLLSLDKFGMEEGVYQCPGWMNIFYVPFWDSETLWTFSNNGGLKIWKEDKVTFLSTLPLKCDVLKANQWIGFRKGEMIWGPELNPTRTRLFPTVTRLMPKGSSEALVYTSASPLASQEFVGP